MIADYRKIPKRTIQALDRWVNQGILPGSFLRAVLSNDLYETVLRADKENLEALPHIVVYVYTILPTESRGSHQALIDWIREHRFKEHNPNKL